MQHIKIFFCFSLLFVLSIQVYAQNKTVSGQVTSGEDNESLPGVSVYVKGDATKGMITDLDGRYTLDVPNSAILVFSYVGYQTQELSVAGRSVLNVALQAMETTLQDVLVIGSRNASRTSTDTPVPVDVLDVQALNLVVPQINVNQMLNYLAPSFTSTTQTVADGTDHIDPASLRGLGPDQVLVLINGKRRHSSSLVNVNGTVGRGNVGTDMNSIPAYAIKRIEILRDGAAAQYGSDAIAGVINIVLKDQYNKLDLSITSGGNFSENANNFDGGVDGEDVQLNANYGIPIGKKDGFINFTGSFYLRNPTSRARPWTGSVYNRYNSIEWQAAQDGFDLDELRSDVDAVKRYAQNVPHFSSELKEDINLATLDSLQSWLRVNTTDEELLERGLSREDFNMKVGQSALRSGRFFMNAAIPLSHDLEFYSFGGISYRASEAAGFYRRPDQSRANTAVYINGFLPHIYSDVRDESIAVGIRGKRSEWNIDFSNTWGRNSFLFSVRKSSNASMGKATKVAFNAGRFSFTQNTSNLDVSRFYKNIFQGMNIAFGAEYRVENYRLIAGEEASYATYYTDGTVATGVGDPARTVYDFFGRKRPAGAQVFPGFKPSNERDEFRNSIAAYVDLEADITQALLITAAARFENYSDFGSTINFKLAGRYKLSDKIMLRLAGNTGFRAPSLHQLHFNATSTNFVDGIPFDIGTFSNDSRVAKLLGIKPLTNETSTSVSGGVTATFPDAGIKITVDGYLIQIKDRVTLTGNFSRPSGTDLTEAQIELQRLFDQASASRARFFANSIDTESMGVDVVVTHKLDFRNGFNLTNSLSASWFQTRQVGDIHASQQLSDAGQTETYFGRADRAYLETALPNLKANLSHTLALDSWSFFLRNAYFGEVQTPGVIGSSFPNAGTSPIYSGKVITDLSIGYTFSDLFNLTVGINNLLDVYPDESPDALTSGAQFIYSRNVSQFGANGRYLFARVNFSF